MRTWNPKWHIANRAWPGGNRAAAEPLCSAVERTDRESLAAMELDPGHLAEHVEDAAYFHVPQFLWPPEGKVYLPGWSWEGEIFGWHWHFDCQLTKFMVLELVAGVLMVVVFIPLARRVRGGRLPRGRFWNLWEAMLKLLRDEVVRPAIGEKEARRFLPFVWNVFFFVLFCNLLGLVPWAGSPTGALSVTAGLAAVAFLMVIGAGMVKHGLLGFWTGMVPPMDLPLALGIALKPMLLAIEVLGLAIRHGVLAVRLLANMFAGHLVLAVVLGFVSATASSFVILWLGVTLASVVGAAALSLLELFVAFLQAYIFAFLSALFIGMAIHQH